MKFESETHRAEITDDGLLRVWAKEVAIRVTQSTHEGGVKVDIHTSKSPPSSPEMKRLLAGLSSMPTFAAAHQTKDEFEIDTSAGMSRWHGPSTTKAIRLSLERCGFEPKDVDTIIKKAKSVKDVPCPYYR